MHSITADLSPTTQAGKIFSPNTIGLRALCRLPRATPVHGTWPTSPGVTLATTHTKLGSMWHIQPRRFGRTCTIVLLAKSWIYWHGLVNRSLACFPDFGDLKSFYSGLCSTEATWLKPLEMTILPSMNVRNAKSSL